MYITFANTSNIAKAIILPSNIIDNITTITYSFNFSNIKEALK